MSARLNNQAVQLRDPTIRVSRPRAGAACAVLALLAFGGAAAQAQFTWTGGGDGTSWFDPDNWSPPGIPNSASPVVIDLPGTYTVTVNGAAHAALVTMGADDAGDPDDVQTLLVPNGSSLSVAGNVLLHDGADMWLRVNASISGILTISGQSQVRVDPGDVCCAATLTVGNGVSSSGTIRLSSSASQAAGITITGGILTNNASGMIEIEPGAGGARSISGTISNSGTLRFGVTGNFTGSLANTAAGVIDVNPSTPCCAAVPTIAGNLSNSGLVRLTSSVSQASGLTVTSGTLTNGGTLELLAGAGGMRELNGTVSNSGTLTVATSSNLSGNYSISSGTVNLSSPTPVTLASYMQTGGTLGGTGQVNVSGAVTFSGGILGGSGVLNANGTTMTITSGTITDSRTLNIASTVTATQGGGSLFVAQDAVINNHGTYIFQPTNGNGMGGGGPAGLRAFNNRSGGIFRKMNAEGASVTVPFQNDGTVQVAGGTLVFASGSGGVHSGSFIPDAGTILHFGHSPQIGGDVHTAGPMSSFSGAGRVTVSGGMLNVHGSYNVGGTTINGAQQSGQSSGVLHLPGPGTTGDLTTTGSTDAMLTGGGTLDVTATATLSGGALAGNGVVNVNGTTMTITNARIQDSRVLNIASTVTAAHGNGSLFLVQDGVINNHGTYIFQPINGHGIGGSATGARAFNNRSGATFRKMNAEGAPFNAPFQNDGTAQVSGGTLFFGNGSGGTHSGNFIADAGAILHFGHSPQIGGDIHTAGPTSSFSGAGRVKVSGGMLHVQGSYNVGGTTINGAQVSGQSSGTLNLPGPGTTGDLTTTGNTEGMLIGGGTLDVTATATLSGGALAGSGVVNINGTTMTITAGSIAETRVLNIASSVTATHGGPGSASLLLSQDAVVNNSGTYVFQPINGNGISGSPTGLRAFNNLSGAVFRMNGLEPAPVVIPFHNDGTVEAQSSTMSFVGGYTQTDGATLLTGGQMQSSTPMAILGGVVAGEGTITGSVNNSGGTISPGLHSAGQLTVTGNYTQGPAGVLEIEIGGSTPVTEYDVFNIGGMGGLGGMLVMLQRDLYMSDIGDEFDVLFAMGGFVGQFNAVMGSGQYTVSFESQPTPHLQVTTVVAPLTGDLDGDCDVDLSDLATLLSAFGCDALQCMGDVDGDGLTDLGDLAALLSSFGATCP